MAALNPDESLLLTYFTGNGETGLKAAASEDGYNFRALNRGKGLWVCTIGQQKLVRDPCFCQGPDGTFHVVWTTGWAEPCFGYASTRDFKSWGPQTLIEPWPNTPGVTNCWAPEITFDPELGHYLIYWSSTLPDTPNKIEGDDGNHRIYYTLTTDFRTFTPTQLLFDPGFNVIDASIVRDGSRWLMFVKDERKVPVAKKNLFIAEAPQLDGPYQIISEPFSGKPWAEGPTAVKLGDRWHVWFDRYTDHRYAMMTSTDLKTWSDESDAISLPTGVRHFTVARVPRSIIQGLEG